MLKKHFTSRGLQSSEIQRRAKLKSSMAASIFERDYEPHLLFVTDRCYLSEIIPLISENCDAFTDLKLLSNITGKYQVKFAESGNVRQLESALFSQSNNQDPCSTWSNAQGVLDNHFPLPYAVWSKLKIKIESCR